MVAPIYKNQPLQMSPSFSVKDVVEQHTKETVTAPLLEMEPEPAIKTRSADIINEYLDMPSSSSSTSSINTASKKKKSVTFSNDVVVRDIPVLTQQEKNDMFFNKIDKRNSKLQLKRLVTYHRVGRNNYFFGVDTSPSDQIIQISEDEKTKIGLEAHINPGMKIVIRRRMTKLVLQHQDWSRQHPTFFDDQFLGSNCTTIAKSSTLMALERAQTVIKELKEDKVQEGPMTNIRVNMNKPRSTSEDYSTTVAVFCSPDAIPNANATVTAPAIETVAVDTTDESRMEAPGQACMVR